MSLDLNKTAATHRATATASYYLAARGYKPIETEVGVFNGWIADLASYVYPTNTELKQMKILQREDRSGKRILSTDEALQNFERRYGEGPFTAIVEVKVTKADFQKDLDFKFSGRVFPAHFCYLAYPAKLDVELPKGWIGLLLNDKCDRVVKMKYAYSNIIHPQPSGDIIDLVAAVGIRRHHRTEYAERRDWIKAFRAKESDRKKGNDIHSAMKVIEQVILGNKPIDEILDDRYIKNSFLKKDIQRIIETLQTKLKELESEVSNGRE